MNADFKNKISNLYLFSEKNVLLDSMNTTVNSHNSEYNKNIIIVLVIVFGLTFFYLKIQVSKDIKNWDFKKCTPKYLFFSGYIYNDTSLTNSDATLYNFVDCTNKYVSTKNEYLVGRMIGRSVKNIKQNLLSFDNNNKKKQKKRKKELKKMEADISGQFNALKNKAEFNLDLSGTYAYSSIKNSGIYIDQINGLINYIGKYIKQYLTYQMIEHANECIKTGDCNENNETYKKAVKINNILQRFGGNNL